MDNRRMEDLTLKLSVNRGDLQRIKVGEHRSLLMRGRF
jgi:hypothetical protein